METIDDDEDGLDRNVAPRKKTRVLELADGSDDDDLPLQVSVRFKFCI
jgi:hypothetical protein